MKRIRFDLKSLLATTCVVALIVGLAKAASTNARSAENAAELFGLSPLLCFIVVTLVCGGSKNLFSLVLPAIASVVTLSFAGAYYAYNAGQNGGGFLILRVMIVVWAIQYAMILWAIYWCDPPI